MIKHKFKQSILVESGIWKIVPIVNVELYDDENIIVDFNCGISMLYNINQIPSKELKQKLLEDKDFYYNNCEYTNYGIYWDTDGIDAYRIWEDGEIL